MDLNRQRFTKQIAGKDLILEVSNLASQTNGSVLATYGGTTVLATVVMDKKDSESSYFPLRVDYEEKFYAAGKILGSQFIRREGRPSEDATLSSRIVDRVIRPLFNHRMRRAVQVTATILSYDGENDPDFVALMASSAALAISDIPWDGPAAAIRIAKVGGELKVSPTNSEVAELKEGELDAFIAGTADRINMIELGGFEASEDDVQKACEEAQKALTELVQFQNEIVEKVGKAKVEVEIPGPSDKFAKTAKAFLEGKLDPAIYVQDKKEREDNISNLEESLKEHLTESGIDEGELVFVADFVDAQIDERVHQGVLKEEKRPDGRALDEVRPLYGEVGTIERMHGSAIFTRGDTQALAITTLGAPGDKQTIETIEFSGKRRFMLHYNFPPFSVGEARSFRGPGRRDIGHGALAQKAIQPMLPDIDTFPYVIRVVSEILSSNGSSSMATVSATSMSLMDAGVPIKEPVAGIAIGLILGEDGSYKVLTDIQGPEDHHGDMDFKVAGTKNGINAVQVDVKIDGLTSEMVKDALVAAKEARGKVLETTNKAIGAPREELSQYAPRILLTKIDPERIGELIGPGGKVINKIIEDTGVDSIDIEEDGTVMITTTDAQKGNEALTIVQEMMKEYEVGEIVEGEIIKTLDFGAIVDLGGGHDGMIHISEFKEGFVKDINSVAKVGDKVKAKVISAEKGKIGLSIKQVEA